MAGDRWGHVPTAPGELSHRQPLVGAIEALPVALQLRVPPQKLEAERHRLGVDAVGPPDHRGSAISFGEGPRVVDHRVEAGSDEVETLPDADALRGVDEVGRRHAEVHPLAGVGHVLGKQGEKRDHVVVERLLQLRHRRRIGHGLSGQLLGRARGRSARGLERGHQRDLDLFPYSKLLSVAPDLTKRERGCNGRS